MDVDDSSGRLARAATRAEAPPATSTETLGRDLARTVRAKLVVPSVLPRAQIGQTAHDEFVIRGELGRGGMASVMLAVQRSLRREVALKRLLDARPDAEDLLLHEAVITGQLEHPNIVPVHAIVSDAAGPAVVLKRVSGISWETLIERKASSLDRHLEIFGQVCNAIAFAHSRGVMHLDIKPSNVMLGDFGEVYVMDWGLARRLGDPDEESVIGTPCYLAPEMAAGRFSPASDIFLLGATLYELVMGRAPYLSGDALTAIGRAVACEPLAFDKSAPEELANVCRRACAAQPGDRYPDVPALQKAVTEYRDRRAARLMLERAEESALAMRSRIAEGNREPRRYAEIQSRFSEARLAYEQALESWHDSEQAVNGLTTLLTDMIDHELSLGHDDTALSLLEAMKSPSPALVERVQSATGRITDARTRLAQLERETDPNVGARGRGRAFKAFFTAVLLMIAVLALSRVTRPQLVPSTRRLASVGTLVLALMLSAVVIWGWRNTFNQINRRIAILCVGTLSVSALHRWTAVVLGTPPEQVLIADAFILCVAGVALSFFHRAGLWLAGLTLLVAALGTLWPSWIDDLFMAVTVTVPALAYALRERRAKTG